MGSTLAGRAKAAERPVSFCFIKLKMKKLELQYVALEDGLLFYQ